MHRLLFAELRAAVTFRSLRRVCTAIVALLAVTVAATAHAQTLPPQSQWRLHYTTLPHPRLSLRTLQQQAAVGQTIPFWTAQTTSPLDGQTYTMSMAGGSPFITPQVNTSVSVAVLALRIHFTNGTVLDPTQSAACDSTPAITRFMNSPFFVPQTFVFNGVNVSSGVTGGTQFMSAFQRANFWSMVQGSQYGVTLTPSPPVVVDVYPTVKASTQQVSIKCGSVRGVATVGLIGTVDYDRLIQGVIAAHATPNQLAIIFTRNVLLDAGSFCCFGGYHSATPVAGGTQTYVVTSYYDPGVFPPASSDVSAYSHEIGEWLDDPFVQAAVPGGGADDLTPPWGHIGQVSGCQNNLEVGDPLDGPTDSNFSLGPGVGGFVYHTQDLTFHDWFFRTSASGAGGKYSFEGTFTGVQGACH